MTRRLVSIYPDVVERIDNALEVLDEIKTAGNINDTDFFHLFYAIFDIYNVKAYLGNIEAQGEKE